MVRDSRSPGRSNRSEHYGRDSRDRRRDEYDSRRKGDRRRDDEQADLREGTSGGGYRDSGYRREGESSRGYRGSDRDRDRKDRRGDDTRSRRSASPPRQHSSRPRSRSRSKPPSGSRSKSPVDKAKPNFAHSGLLAAATKTVKASDGTSTVLKYHEPPEARRPVVGWRLYVFKGSEQVELLHIHRQSAYLFGRDKTVCDITLDHPSCSKQHAVVQFRQVQEKNEFGETKAVVKPFIIDLESTNGTQVNDQTVPTSRYFELRLSDVIKFGESTREYVLLSEDAA